jgi:DNA-directed RNA polymerase III subunit RPC3
VRHGLAVLLQQNLLFYQANTSTYEANALACYNIVRSGKIITMIGSEYGSAEQELAQRLLLLGHARVSDLEGLVEERLKPRPIERRSYDRHETNRHQEPAAGDRRVIDTISQLHGALARLIDVNIIEPVGSWTFESPEDTYHDIESEVTKVRPGEKSAKTKSEQQQELLKRLGDARDRTKGLKRHLENTSIVFSKRRRMENGDTSNHVCVLDSPKLLDVGTAGTID